MSNFGGRIGTVERQLGGGGCLVCGYGQGRPMRVELVLPDNGRGDRMPDPTHCGACGRPLVITLRIGEMDLDDGRPDA